MPDPIVVSQERLRELTDLLASWPGLVASATPELVEDSLVLLPFLGPAQRVIDVGSGGGLPGLPLKVARPELEIALLEANRRKAAFLVHAVARLGLQGVEVLALRAEDAGRDSRYRERFDVAVVRALAHLAVLSELCLPFVRRGGRLLAMKAGGAREEALSAAAAIEALGGQLVEIAPTPSPAREQGQVVIVEKTRSTPARFPRRSGVPSRKPLGI